MRIGSLFSGYGGLDLAVMAALGGEVTWHSEIDPHPARVLAARFPDVPNLGDITKVDWSAVEPVDVLCGGFPCQDISNAGKRAGIEGARSGLWSEFARAIRILRPGLVVVENVAALLGRGLGRVLGDLAECGYDAQWMCVSASDVGACHRRKRLFLAAHPAGERLAWAEHAAAGRSGATDDAGRLDLAAADTDDFRHDGRRGAWGRWAEPAHRSLPTPTVRDGKGHNQRGDDSCLTGALLPTCRATDGVKGGPGQRGSSGDLMLPSAVVLLPTPACNDMGEGKTPEAWDSWTDAMQARHGNGNGHGKSLAIEAQRLLPTPTSTDRKASGGNPDTTGTHGVTLTDATVREPDRWGEYADAIHRHERAFGRLAPPPTQLSTKGTPQLSPRFSEWMMGLPAGWVTDPAIWEGLTDRRGRVLTGSRLASAARNAQLHVLGNGVVPAQAEAALRLLLSDAWTVAA